MKKLFTILLIISMLLPFIGLEVFAANPDITFTATQSHTVSFVKYGNFTVKSGANVKLVNCGFEIAGSLTVESGATLTGVTQAGDFVFSLCKGCKVKGLDLYYQSENGNKTEYVKIPLSRFDDWGSCDYLSETDSLAFKWNTEINGWCINHSIGGNPFNIIFYHSEYDMNQAEDMANELHSIGLFQGTGTKSDGSPEYSLGRAPTRVEALVMLIRLLGKENEALNGNWNNPFNDVPTWADKYIGYAYEKELTKGVSATSFGTGNATIQQYVTFVLRALGYSDNDTNSTLYDNALKLGETVGLTVNKDPNRDWDRYNVCADPFWRADIAVISFRALYTVTKSGKTLEETLKEQNNNPPAENDNKWGFISSGKVDENALLSRLDTKDLELIAGKLQSLVEEEMKDEAENPEIILSEGYPRVFAKTQFNEVIEMGERAAVPLFYIIYKSENNGMYEHICATALCKITGLDFMDESGDFNSWSTAKEYLNLFIDYWSKN